MHLTLSPAGSTSDRTHAAADRPVPAAEPTPRTAARRDADGMAVGSFVLGLLGLLVANLFLGPTAIVLSSLALARGTGRRGRALFGLSLGVADLVVLAVLVTADHTWSWNIPG
ncbi:hypothetical protein GCM10018793_36060 [Streptomyces sulfonofaciens]|uniref:DUF4190 domain-containing protein n=1 Tax=Streptomyces sulfonofaciens TaxID=68272 RepID=A0A919G9T8_9ACTN|nr:hypothetical protein [Streptomyces sulfonofaciens]GHH80586.1 hypothetical protein GCM10018793_36060 [Streptomyces sulfonofaciens]